MKPRLVERIWEGDFKLWAPEPTEITDRLGWLTVAAENLEPADTSGDYQHLVLVGMGGSSLAPEVFSLELGRGKLRVLDTTSPAAILRVTSEVDPDETLFIVASKSGTTLETLSHFAHFWSLVPDGNNFIAITDPGSPLESLAHEHGFSHVYLNPPDIGGRYSALSQFGLIPAALDGADVASLRADAIDMADACRESEIEKNPGASLGAAMGQAALEGRDKLSFAGPIGSWVEQLIAESTGKDGKGILPVIDDPGTGADRFVVAQGTGADADVVLPHEGMGAACFRWEFAAAVAGTIIGINAFDQPNVAEAKEATNKILAGGSAPVPITSSDGVLGTLKAGDYIAVQAFADPTPEMTARLESLRTSLSISYGVAVTAGFGPRYLHSTGQYHKGGPNTGVFLQAVEEVDEDVPIPGREFTFGELIKAQADGDFKSLEAHGRRVVRLTMDELLGM